MSVKNMEFFKLIEDFIDDYREANGDSMIGVNINDGDLVLIRQ